MKRVPTVKRALFLIVVTVGTTWLVLVLAFFLGGVFSPEGYPPTELINGYFYNHPGDASSLDKFISSTNTQDRGVVVEPTVDEYRVVGSKILVARRNFPQATKVQSNWKQELPICEYWVVDTIAHTAAQTRKTPEWGALDCYGLVRNE